MYDGSYQTEQGRVIGLIVGFHIGIPAVYCCEVLGQVIGANAGKVHFFGSLVRQKGDRGDFNHDADLHGFAEGDTLGLKLCFCFGKTALGTSDIIHAGDHGKHEPEVSADGCPQCRPQLGVEHVRILKAQAQRTVAQKWIVLFGNL